MPHILNIPELYNDHVDASTATEIGLDCNDNINVLQSEIFVIYFDILNYVFICWHFDKWPMYGYFDEIVMPLDNMYEYVKSIEPPEHPWLP